MGLIDFEFLGNPEHLEVHVFEARTFSGKLKLSYGSKHFYHVRVLTMLFNNV